MDKRETQADGLTLRDVAQMIADQDRQFYTLIGGLLDAMGAKRRAPMNDYRNTKIIPLWRK